jgi:uncharacterized protein YodC (DUF2158 family)
MRGKPKVNQAVIVKHEEKPVVMHIDSISEGEEECSCVWHDRIGAPYRSTFKTEILEAYKPAKKDKEDKEDKE